MSGYGQINNVLIVGDKNKIDERISLFSKFISEYFISRHLKKNIKKGIIIKKLINFKFSRLIPSFKNIEKNMQNY